jgi:hypothetical protein
MNAGGTGLDTKDLVEVCRESIWSHFECSGLPDVTVEHVWDRRSEGWGVPIVY